MQKKLNVLAVLVIFTLFGAAQAQARMGGGGSFGSRGSRGFSSRPSSPSYNRYNSRPSQTNPQANPNDSRFAQPAPIAPAGGGFLRNMAGGIAGGFLGSMLFRSLGFGGMGYGDGMGMGGGIGMLEILLLAGIAFFVIRMLLNRSFATSGAQQNSTGFSGMNSESSRYAESNDDSPASEPEVADVVRRYDPTFNPQTFKEGRLDDFFAIQAHWSRRDLNGIEKLFTPEIKQTLDGQLAQLTSAGRVNRLENIAVRDLKLTEAWQEMGREYVSLHFVANLLDYTVDEKTGVVVEGSQDRPVKFEEDWTYVREAGNAQSAWRLSAIQNF